MNDTYAKSIDFLLENAGPVIQYRLRKDILKDLPAGEEEKLLEKICELPLFKLLFFCSKAALIRLFKFSVKKISFIVCLSEPRRSCFYGFKSCIFCIISPR